MQEVKLIVTDLDGTLIGNDNEFAFCTQLVEVIGSYRAKYGAVWAVCSGRSKGSVRESIAYLQTIGLEPDYVLVRSSFMYANERHRLRARHLWNWGVQVHMLMSHFELKFSLREWQEEMNTTFKNVICLYQRRNRICLRFRNREDADSGAEILRRKTKALRHLRIYQYLSEVEVRSISFTKGMAVEELAGRLGVKRSETLCIGNGLSDISMLDGSVGLFTGCPSNSEMDVIDQVHQAGGYIAEGRSMEGVVQILDGYLRGDVKNTLPAWWSPSHAPKQPWMGRSRHRPAHKPMQAKQRSALQIGLLAGYAVLVVFASFGLVPFSGIIMKPFVVVSGWVARIMQFFML